jgi:hypothetical protein
MLPEDKQKELVKRFLRAPKTLRRGQALMSALYDVDRYRYLLIAGSHLNCFYNEARVSECLDYLFEE